jgi:sigma-E factor negative regulatory protein RseB
MRRACLAILATTGLLALPVQAADDDAHQWLERMTEALSSRNYTGVFTHATRRQSETMRIVHRVGKDATTERLVSLDGNGREIVRTAEEVHVYLPDRGVVLVEQRTDGGLLLDSLPDPGPELDATYVLQLRDGHKLLGRKVRMLDIMPRDGLRYGYRLWLDEETAMPLRTMVLDRAGRPVEVVNFTQIDMPRHIDAKATEPSIDATGFKWVRTARRPPPGPPAPVAWRPTRLPPGFRLVASRIQVVPGVAFPVQHLIFSDGFASISVFIEPPRPAGPAPSESSSVGSANAFSTVVHGRVVTAVGEVPLETVRDVAQSVEPAMQPPGVPPDDEERAAAGVLAPAAVATAPGVTALQPH